MGCLHTKLESNNRKPTDGYDRKGPETKMAGNTQNDGAQFTNLSQTHENSVGLTVKQMFSLKQSWKGIKRKMEETGVEMFVRLFKTNSGLQTMFQGFKDICTDDELRSNEALEYHATLVMSTLDDAITHIDNYDFVRQLLHRTGASHIRFPNFQPENFYAIKEPFLEAVRVTLGDRYTENMENIYSVAITFILDTLVQGMKEAVGKVGEEGTGTNGSA